MRVEDMAVVTAEIAADMEDTVADMPRPATLGADMLAMSKLDTLFAAGVGSTMRAVRAGTRAMQGAHLPGIAAVTGEAAVNGGGNYGYPYYGYSRYGLGYYGLGYGYPYYGYGYYGYRSGWWYGSYYPYYPYRYGYWPYLSFSFWGY